MKLLTGYFNFPHSLLFFHFCHYFMTTYCVDKRFLDNSPSYGLTFNKKIPCSHGEMTPVFIAHSISGHSVFMPIFSFCERMKDE